MPVPLLKLPVLALLSFYPLQAQTGGLELDALPYATGGWYLSGWVGRDRTRLRLVGSGIHVPEAFSPDGWDRQRIDATALLVDRFLRPGFSGPWVGTGIERWETRIRCEANGATAHYQSLQATFGGGWVFRCGAHFTLNPWSAVHVRIAGDRETTAGGATFKPRKVMGEASIKAGWQF